MFAEAEAALQGLHARRSSSLAESGSLTWAREWRPAEAGFFTPRGRVSAAVRPSIRGLWTGKGSAGQWLLCRAA